MYKFSAFTSAMVFTFINAWSVHAAQVCDEPFGRPSYPTRNNFCTTGDVLTDAYDPNRSILCEEMEVDHLISLRQAWASGVCGDDLKRLARDPRNLRFTHWQTNRKKGYLSPEEFAQVLKPDVASTVLRDATELMKDYGIKPREEAMYNRMLSVAKNSAKSSTIAIGRIARPLVAKLVLREIGGKTIVFIGKKAVGYALGVGAAVEGVQVAGWAVSWLTTPSQSDRMRERAVALMDIMEGDE